jgi:hypothetical protein
MSCTLSFNRSPFYCVVPWPSVFAMVGEDGRGMVWPDEMPPELTKPAATVSVVRDEAEAPSKKAPSKRTPNVEEAREAPEARMRRLQRAPSPVPSGKERPEPAAAVERGGKKRKKGKGSPAEVDAEARPLLVAIPGPAAETGAASPPAAAEKANDRPSERGLDAERRPAARPVAAPPGKRKRELPPYLRVVK